MTAAALLADLTDRAVHIEADEGRLRFHPRSAVPDQLLAQLRVHKAELLVLLAAGDGGPCPVCRCAIFYRL